MAKQANRMMIGGFVVFAVTIMAASLVVFGSGKFFQITNKYILYFNEPINGLSVGAPVLFQGVPIGQVTDITLQADLATMKTQIPVLIEIYPDRWKVRGGKRDYRAVAEKLIEKGLRAQLITQSFITGQLMIQLDFLPEAGLCYAPAKMDEEYKDYVVVPTCASTAEKLANALQKLDLAKLERHLESAMDGIAKLVNDPDLAASIRGLKDTLQDARKLVTKVDRQVDPLSRNLNKTLTDFGKLAVKVDDKVGGVATGFDKTMAKASNLLSEDSPLIVDLENTLQEISAMSRSIRQLTNYLDQHPEALIRGKGKPGGK
ncbi:MAG: MlaD family protein [Syntrophobacterales bacterium]|jgi:paraquat-inducible protein B|nr:MlaD family protein [Syntrophobacterales bacterium]